MVFASPPNWTVLGMASQALLSIFICLLPWATGSLL